MRLFVPFIPWSVLKNLSHGQIRGQTIATQVQLVGLKQRCHDDTVSVISGMSFFLDKIAKLDVGWNARTLGERDAFRMAERLGVEVQVKPMTVDGFYFRAMGREFITINRDLPRIQRLKVLFHELAHLLFHAPASGPAFGFHRVGKRNRQEIEADAFATCALLPLAVFKTKTVDELVDEGFDPTLLAERAEIWQRFGV